MPIPGHKPVFNSEHPYMSECECGAWFYGYENHAISVRVYELLDYMEDNGYDPIGSSDLRADAAQWLYPRIELWPLDAPELYRRWRGVHDKQ